MRDTPMRWPMGDARLWETHAYEGHAYEMAYGRDARPVWDARLWDAYPVRCTPMRGTLIRWPSMGEMHAYGRYVYEMAVYERDARL